MEAWKEEVLARVQHNGLDNSCRSALRPMVTLVRGEGGEVTEQKLKSALYGSYNAFRATLEAEPYMVPAHLRLWDSFCSSLLKLGDRQTCVVLYNHRCVAEALIDLIGKSDQRLRKKAEELRTCACIVTWLDNRSAKLKADSHKNQVTLSLDTYLAASIRDLSFCDAACDILQHRVGILEAFKAKSEQEAAEFRARIGDLEAEVKRARYGYPSPSRGSSSTDPLASSFRIVNGSAFGRSFPPGATREDVMEVDI